MKKFQPLFLENLRISIPGFSILRFAHHRHTPKSDQVEEHQHRHSQFLLYLRGQGVQTLNHDPIAVRRGSFLFFPPLISHGFIKSTPSPPMSLVINFKQKDQKFRSTKNKVLSPSKLSEIEINLNQMMGSADLNDSYGIASTSKILHIFSILVGELEPKPVRDRKVYPVTEMIRRKLHSLPSIPRYPIEIASLTGEDLSSLNRKIRRESGLNLGALLDEIRQERSISGLKDEKMPIARVAWDCGFQDPNYYARWFRKKMGQSPRQWRAGHR